MAPRQLGSNLLHKEVNQLLALATGPQGGWQMKSKQSAATESGAFEYIDAAESTGCI
jgi:hypothetical protein